MSDVLCLYHANCTDGFAAAWVLHRFLPEAEFIPARHGDPPPDVTGKCVYIVDFSYPRATLLEMKEKAQSLVVLDHHKTAQKELEGLDFCHFDMSRSGAMMAWDYFAEGVAAPWILPYVQDRDLWKWELENSKAVNAFIGSIPMNFMAWDYALHTTSPAGAIMSGQAILKNIAQQVSLVQSYATEIELSGFTVPYANSPIYQSEIGHELCQGKPFAIVWYFDGKKFVYSLRSDEDGVDVSEIAKTFGGGGHKHAAGFSTQILLI